MLGRRLALTSWTAMRASSDRGGSARLELEGAEVEKVL